MVLLRLEAEWSGLSSCLHGRSMQTTATWMFIEAETDRHLFTRSPLIESLRQTRTTLYLWPGARDGAGASEALNPVTVSLSYFPMLMQSWFSTSKT